MRYARYNAPTRRTTPKGGSHADSGGRTTTQASLLWRRRIWFYRYQSSNLWLIVEAGLLPDEVADGASGWNGFSSQRHLSYEETYKYIGIIHHLLQCSGPPTLVSKSLLLKPTCVLNASTAPFGTMAVICSVLAISRPGIITAVTVYPSSGSTERQP